MRVGTCHVRGMTTAHIANLRVAHLAAADGLIPAGLLADSPAFQELVARRRAALEAWFAEQSAPAAQEAAPGYQKLGDFRAVESS